MAEPLTIDPKLYEFCTVKQLEILKAIEANGSARAAAKALGIGGTVVLEQLARVKRKAQAHAYSPEHGLNAPLPLTHAAKGLSLHYTKGELDQHWVKGDLKQEVWAALVKQAIDGFVEGVGPIDAPPAPLDFQNDIIPWIQIGDAHVGMLAHIAETTENFDLKIAERELCTAISMLIDEMPHCERIVINDLGDFTHYQNMAGISESGHSFDLDGRMPKMIRVYSKVMRFIVDKVLTKAKHVDVIVNQGNHSRVNDLWMRELLEVAYGHTGRVHVLANDGVFVGYRMGQTLVMVHHGDKCPPNRLVGVLITDFRKDFGETDFHYIDHGHVHHHYVSKEYPSVVIESWNNLPPNDKWGHESGYRSRKSISVILRSRTYGDLGRRVLPIEEIRARIERTHGLVTPVKKEAFAV